MYHNYSTLVLTILWYFFIYFYYEILMKSFSSKFTIIALPSCLPFYGTFLFFLLRDSHEKFLF